MHESFAAKSEGGQEASNLLIIIASRCPSRNEVVDVRKYNMHLDENEREGWRLREGTRRSTSVQPESYTTSAL
jgi:hypothetical protein